MTEKLIQLSLILMTFCIIGPLRPRYVGHCFNNDAIVTHSYVTRFQCPTSCTCRNISDFQSVQTQVHCTRNVSVLSLPFTTTMLTIILHDKSLKMDLGVFLRHFGRTNITKLALVECNLNSFKLEVATLAELSSLKKLDLSGNRLTEPLQLDGLANLSTLDLSRNHLHTADGDYNGNLRNLNLSFNQITNVTSLGNLTKLEFLDLSSNYLVKLSSDVFWELVNLQYLNLSNNKIELLNSNCFNNLLHLQQLDVSHNHLTSVELQSLPNLARLTLSGNPHLGDLLIGTGRRLQAVDASSTGLEFVPPALTHSVRTLRLSSNAIHTVRCGDFDSYPLLQLLDFTDNGLELIEEDALGRLEMLTMLFLNENKLTFVPRSLPEAIRVLHLERNVIDSISDGDFRDLKRLEVLLLNDNNISVLRKGVFDNLNALFTLDLSGNPIGTIEAGALSNVNNLEILRLAGLPLATLTRDTAFPIYSLDRLINLDLTASPGLARMLLADDAALSSIKFLQELSLADAGLIHIRPDLLGYLPQLHCLKLNGNRLDCGQLEWLAAWLRLQNRDDDKNVICFGPPHLAGTLLIDLQENFVHYVNTTNARQSKKSEKEKKNLVKQKVQMNEISKEANHRGRGNISNEILDQLVENGNDSKNSSGSKKVIKSSSSKKINISKSVERSEEVEAGTTEKTSGNKSNSSEAGLEENSNRIVEKTEAKERSSNATNSMENTNERLQKSDSDAPSANIANAKITRQPFNHETRNDDSVASTHSTAINIPFSRILIMKNSSIEINDVNLSTTQDTVKPAKTNASQSISSELAIKTGVARTITKRTKNLARTTVRSETEIQSPTAKSTPKIATPNRQGLRLQINAKNKDDILRDIKDEEKRNILASFHIKERNVAKFSRNGTLGIPHVIKLHNKSLSTQNQPAPEKTNLNAANRNDIDANPKSIVNARTETTANVNYSSHHSNSTHHHPNHPNRTLIGEIKATNAEILNALEASLHLAANQETINKDVNRQKSNLNEHSDNQHPTETTHSTYNKSTREFLRDDKYEYESPLKVHAGFIIVAIVGVCLCVSFVIASKLRHSYRSAALLEEQERCSDNNLLSYSDNIEVNQLPHVTDLW